MVSVVMYAVLILIALAALWWSYQRNRGKGGRNLPVGFTLIEIVIIAVVGVVNGVLGTPNAIAGRFLMTFSGTYGFLLFSLIAGGFYVSAVLAGYIVRKPGAAMMAEVFNGIAQLLSGNPNGVVALLAGLLQGAGAEVAFATWGYRKFTLPVVLLSGALSPILQQLPEAYYFGVGPLGIPYNILSLAIRMFSGAVYAGVIVIPLGIALAKAGVLRGTLLARAVQEGHPGSDGGPEAAPTPRMAH
ncbi:MAG: ECF transporter S component [Candidatus Acidiferrales bacterium]